MNTAIASLTKGIDRVKKLRVRTMERAASSVEEDAAAAAIGRILMRHPGLVVVDGSARPAPRDTSVMREQEGVRLHPIQLVRLTAKAVFVFIKSEERRMWLPKSHVVSVDWTDESITVTAWLWRKRRSPPHDDWQQRPTS